MKKIIIIFGMLICSLLFVVTFTGCAAADGLHNQEASNVTFTVRNFTAAVDGSYSIPGNYNNWDNTSAMLSLKSGEGKTEAQTVTNSFVKFTLVMPESWTRTWYPTVNGNSVDETSNTYVNFYADITLGTDVSIIIDGSTSPATVTVE